MATTKLLRNRNIVALYTYIVEGADKDSPIDSGGGIYGSEVVAQMLQTQLSKGFEDATAIHLLQNFSARDSKLKTPDELNAIGRETVESAFPGREYFIVTHTDTEYTHNHIILNPISVEKDVNKVPSKIKERLRFREKSDLICDREGLSIVRKQSDIAWESLPEEVRKINSRRGFSWVLDLKEKADFAKTVATSFDEYAGVLNQFGIGVVTRDKTISYHYPGKNSKRGNSKGLGKPYTKAELIEQFKVNYQEFSEKGLVPKGRDSNSFEEYWKIHRSAESKFVPEYRYKDSVLPIDWLKNIQSKDIIELLRRREIQFQEDSKGSYYLKDKENIVLQGNQWVNIDNSAKGGVVEILSYLSNSSYLKVILEEKGSEKAKKLLLELSEKPVKYQGFFIKRQRELKDNVTQTKIAEKLGFSAIAVRKLVSQNRVRFYEEGRLRLSSATNEKRSLSLYRNKTKWVSKKSRGLADLFLFHNSKRNTKALVVESPLVLLKSQKLAKLLLKDKLDFNFYIPMKPLREFMQENEEKLRRHTEITVFRDEQTIKWGEKGKNKYFNYEINEHEGGIQEYESIDELLKDLIMSKKRQR